MSEILCPELRRIIELKFDKGYYDHDKDLTEIIFNFRNDKKIKIAIGKWSDGEIYLSAHEWVKPSFKWEWLQNLFPKQWEYFPYDYLFWNSEKDTLYKKISDFKKKFDQDRKELDQLNRKREAQIEEASYLNI